MPKVTAPTTFTACWTCRRRNVRCDTTRPSCSNCKRSHLLCEGYDIRLVWVDQKTGAYPPQQRRAYDCNATWKGYPGWNTKQVDHLINECERPHCRCALHHVPSPFTAFPMHDSEIGNNIIGYPEIEQVGKQQYATWVTQFGYDHNGIQINVSKISSSVGMWENAFLISGINGSSEVDCSAFTNSHFAHDFDPNGPRTLRCKNAQNTRASKLWAWRLNILYEPSCLLGQNDDENRLLHHYTFYLNNNGPY